MRSLHRARVTKAPVHQKLHAEALARHDDLTDKYHIAVANSFGVLGSLPEDVEACWDTVRTIILDVARDTLPTVMKPNRPWLTTDTLSVPRLRL